MGGNTQAPYIPSQGTALYRSGRVYVEKVGNEIWGGKQTYNYRAQPTNVGHGRQGGGREVWGSGRLNRWSELRSHL